MASSGPRKSSPSKKKPAPPPTEGDVKAFWDAQAEEHGGSDKATNPDQHYRKLEVSSILRVIEQIPNQDILDVGCGNGFTTKAMSEKFPQSRIDGVDFSEKMIEEAILKNAAPNVSYAVGDVLGLSRELPNDVGSYDIVISTRCLINLANWEEQKVGILEMRKMLKPGGRLVLVENIQEGLDNLNSIRTSLGLDPIKVRWHNHYIPQTELMKFLQAVEGHLFSREYTENIGNLYYMMSRVLYAKLCKDEGKEPDYNHPINAIAAQLPTMGEFYACSPNFLIVLKNEQGNAAQADKGFPGLRRQ